jgi:hypothetical protein
VKEEITTIAKEEGFQDVSDNDSRITGISVFAINK